MKKIKFIALFVSVVSLSGCFYQSTNSFDIDRAYTVCGKGNIVEINSNFLGTETVLCRNGKSQSLVDVPAINSF